MTARAAMREFGLGLAAIVFPPHCAVCEEPAATALCDACAQQAWRSEEEPVVLPGLDGVASVGEHAGALREAILALKYGRRRVLAAPLGELLARRLAERQPVWQVELIVPVPSHPRRRRERGVNQTALLARVLARRAGLPVALEGLRRTRYTVPQTALTPAERRARGARAARAHRFPKLAILAPQQAGSTRVHILSRPEGFDQALFPDDLCRYPQLDLRVVADHQTTPAGRGDCLAMLPPRDGLHGRIAAGHPPAGQP